MLEYKGEHMAGSEDSEYKEKIGREWEKISGGDYYFKWAEKGTIDNIISEISKL